MKRLKFLAVTFLFLTLTISAQDFPVCPIQAMQIDEFGTILYSDLMARLDPAVVQLQNDPTSRLHIISYRDAATPIGKTIRTFKFMKTYLVRNRGVESNRLKFIDGGESDAGFVFQMWNVPAGAKEPEILKPINNSINNPKVARKFEEAYYAFDDLEFYSDGNAFTEFAKLLKKEPDSTAYVILYPEYTSYGDENDKPIVRKDSLRKTDRVKADINKQLRKVGIPLAKMKIVNGGYRDFRQVELWILPKGVAPPVATPNAFPKIKRKSGK